MARVLIVGAGPRGLACARTLVAHGHAVDLIEAGARCGGTAVGTEWLAVDSAIEATLTELGVHGGSSTRVPISPWPEPARRAAAKSWVDRLGRVSRRWLDRGADTPLSEGEPGMTWLRPEVLIQELSSNLSVRIGWEVLEASTCGKAAALLVLVPSGERRLEADAVVLAVEQSVALRLVPELGTTPEVQAAALDRKICCVAVDLPGKEKPDAPGQALQLDPASYPDVASVVSIPALGVVRVRLSETAAAGSFEDSDEAVTEKARAALESLLLTADQGLVAVARWTEDRGSFSVPDFPGAVFWARSAADDHGVLGALRAGQRAGIEVASLLCSEA